MTDLHESTFIVEPHAPGRLGERTELDVSVHPPVVHRLHFLFEGWLGDDLVQDYPVYLTTERLARAMDAARLSGVVWESVETEWDDQARLLVGTSPEFPRNLPRDWRWMKIDANPTADLWLGFEARLHVTERALQVLQRFNIDNADVAAGPSRVIPSPDIERR